jgi:hypothetical protein
MQKVPGSLLTTLLFLASLSAPVRAVGSVAPARSSALDGTWTQLAPPSGRYQHTFTYDPVRDRVIVFGGVDPIAGFPTDVWVLSLSGMPRWTRIVPLGAPPNGRQFACAIYDPVRDRIVVFGGTYWNGAVEVLNDVWVLPLSGTPVWSPLTPAGTLPPARVNPSAIYDPVRDRMVMFGGGLLQPTGAAIPLNDVWALSLSGTPAWSQLSPAGSPPAPRLKHTAIYDPIRDRMLVYGGSSMTDVWALSLVAGTSWTRVTTTGLPPIETDDTRAQYDVVRDRMVIYGGVNGLAGGGVWALSLTGSPAWTDLTPAGPRPSSRFSPASIYDPPRDRLLVFGGLNTDNSGYVNDVWVLPMAAGSSWSQLPVDGSTPGPHSGHTAIYDSVRGQMVVFGGAYSGIPSNDVWTLPLSGPPIWTHLVPAGTPPSARTDHTAVFDSARDRMLVFGGTDNNIQELYNGGLNDVWELSLGDTPTWTQLTPGGTAPDPRSGHSAIYDPIGDQMIMYGGYDEYQASNTYDTWSLSLSGTPTWSQLSPAGISPYVGPHHSAIYDPARRRMVIFLATFSATHTGLLALNLSGTPTWTDLAAPQFPLLPLSHHTAVYDPLLDRMLVFGGGGAGGANPYIWSMPLSGAPSWSQLVLDGPLPDGPASPAAIFDPINDRMLVNGGRASSDQWANWQAQFTGVATPTLPSLVSAEAVVGAVKVTWYAPAASLSSAQVLRRTSSSGWARVGSVSADGAGLLVYEDHSVLAGARYGYELGIPAPNGVQYLGEAWVTVPSRASTELEEPLPNPADRDLTVRFSLATSQPATLELVDLAGRVAYRSRLDLAAGNHVLPLPRNGNLAAGIYVVRLRQGDVTRARKVTIRH